MLISQLYAGMSEPRVWFQRARLDKKSAVTKWCGETMNYGLWIGIQELLQQWKKAKESVSLK